MGGKASRRKGLAGEYYARDYFRELGYEANRVPSSGAAEGFKGDIVVKIGELELRAEVKFRKSEYLSIYRLFDSIGPKPHLFVGDNGSCLVSLHFNDLGFLPGERIVEVLKVSGPGPKLKGLQKLFGLKKLLKGCDFLVIRCNHKQPLFIRFYDVA